MITTENLRYAYDDKNSFDFPDIDLGKGETMLVLGESGIGKSTLLHLLGGLMRPTSGHIRIDKQDITKLSESQMDHFRGKNISLIFQKLHFIESLNVTENLLIAQKLAGVAKEREYCRYWLNSLNISHKENDYIKSLSQGEAQRVAIARALVTRPKLILADEPTSALDDKNADAVAQILMERTAEIEAALLIVTHDARIKDVIQKNITLS